ncbi:Dam family site-specific DNA-(adenine-N6)-methyltransferase [Synergistes jonesii]|uniref:Dam family site-specific DNA-(adenine-N6)-methyltransferase n=1 Tax=Synergistes jonesii TaxID=2754 RepID=UPI0033247112
MIKLRFIGGKSALLENIEKAVAENTSGEENVFCDIFSGTGAVARRFKPKYKIISNDMLHFSYVIQKATIENNTVPTFDKLRQIGIADPFSFFEETKIEILDYNDEHYFIAKYYSPHDDCKRMYLSNKNAARIDFIRNTIDAWKKEKLLCETEYYYLLAALIEGVPFVSNITGTYGAYLKQWDRRAYKNFEMARLDVVDNRQENKSYNKDANKLIEEIEGDILYIDPPYNGRQYLPNYHLLETISRYDRPKVNGVTGLRPCADEEKSNFCVGSEVCNVFEHLVEHARFTHLFMSYSSDGLMKKEKIESIFKKHGVADSYKRYDIPYKKYKSKLAGEKDALCEYIFYIRKDFPHRDCFSAPYTLRREMHTAASPAGRILESAKFDRYVGSPVAALPGFSYKTPVVHKKYLKSPLNYIGGKYKLLPQIMPHFPTDIATFVDLFAGGANVAINVAADRIICNDINTKVIEMFRAFQNVPAMQIIAHIYARIEQFALSKTNEEGFLQFRAFYNKAPDPIDLYTLTCYSFNYQLRFNNEHKFNNPFGRARSRFSERMRDNLLAFVNELGKKNIKFTNNDFCSFDISALGPQDMIYCDPPYLITTGSYNDGKRGFKDWGEREERQLCRLLDRADEAHVRFALSNVMEHKGRKNPILREWSRKYNVIFLDSDYANSSYNTSRGTSREVLITNYE